MKKVKAVSPETIAKIEKLWKQGLPLAIIAERLAMPKNTVSHHLRYIRKPNEPMRTV